MTALFAAGCTVATRTIPASQPTERIEMDPVEIHVNPNGTYDVTDAKELFDRAGDELDEQSWGAAIADYDRLLATFPESRLWGAAQYNDGLAHEGKGDAAGAVPHYRAVIEKEPQGADALDAHFRLGGVYAELKRWKESAAELAALLARKDMGIGDRVEAYAREGYAEYEAGDLDTAERTLRAGLDYYDSVSDIERLGNTFYLGMLRFYLARIPHDRFHAQPLRLPQKQLEEDLAAKATLLLTAQGRYIECIDVGNLQWAAAAGYEVGDLYKEFYDDVIAAPIPPELPADVLPYYKQEVRRKLAPLLEKAIRVHEKVVQVAAQHGVDNEWVRGSVEKLALLRHLLAETQNGDEPKDGPQIGQAAGQAASSPASGPAGPAPQTLQAAEPAPLPPPIPTPQQADEYVPRLPEL